jgi:hypothetical protein
MSTGQQATAQQAKAKRRAASRSQTQTRAQQRISARALKEQHQAAVDAIRENEISEPSLKQRLVWIGNGERFAHSNTNKVSPAAGYGDSSTGRSDPAMASVFDGLRLEDLSGVIRMRAQEAFAVGQARGSDDTRETWRGIVERERLETTASLLGAIGDELAPILKGLAAPKGAGDAKRAEATKALVGLCGELASAGRAVQEHLSR